MPNIFTSLGIAERALSSKLFCLQKEKTKSMKFKFKESSFLQNFLSKDN